MTQESGTEKNSENSSAVSYRPKSFERSRQLWKPKRELTEDEEEVLHLRKAYEPDLNYITDSWKKGYFDSRLGGYPNRGVSAKIFNYYHHKLMEQLIRRSSLVVLCNRHDPDQIMGWVCSEMHGDAAVIHFVNVKGDFRGLGLSKWMVRHLLNLQQPSHVFFTHRTMPGAMILSHKGLKWTYNPYLAYVGLPPDWSRDETSKNGAV